MWPVEVVIQQPEKKPETQPDESGRASGSNSPEHSRKASDTAEIGPRGGRSPGTSIPQGSARTAHIPGSIPIASVPTDGLNSVKAVAGGEFKLKLQPEEPQTKIMYNTYEGTFKDNKMHGSGVFHWVNGQIYEGEFANDLRQGYGIMRYIDGSIYDGHWSRGLKHGEGCAIDAQGNKEYGKFVNDKLETPLRFKK